MPESFAPIPAARKLARAFFVLAFLTWILIAFGALVRAKQAGLACPDWPLCHGDALPDLRLKGVVYEFGHRALAGVVALFYAFLAWRVLRYPELRFRMRKHMIGGAILLLVQILFGGLTVLIVHRGSGAPRPEAWTVVTHLILGNSFAALVLLAGLRLQRWSLALPERPVQPLPIARVWHRTWLALLVAQFILGGSVAANIAGLICTDFPQCFPGVWFPSWQGYMALQLLHRLTAYALLLAAFGQAWALRGTGRAGQVAAGLAALVVVQAVLGAVNIYSYLHTAVTTSHSAVAALLFSGTAVLAWLLHRRRNA